MKLLKWMYAKVNLAVAFVIHMIFKRWFFRRGLQHFLKDHHRDGIFLISAKERKTFFEQSRCIQCGYCVTECKVEDPTFYQSFITPAEIAFSYTRSLPEISLNNDFLSHCTSCRACEAVCPTGVPLDQTIDFVKRHAL